MLPFFIAICQPRLIYLHRSQFSPEGQHDMSIILSIESSTRTSSVALHQDGVLLSSQHIHVEKSHSEYLALSIKNLVETSRLAMADIEAVAISKGPGSYTGLRIGTSTAKGLCYGLDAKLIGINTLKAMAYGMSKYQLEDVWLCPMLDARRMEVYCMLMDRELSIIESTQAKIIDENSFSEHLQGKKIVFFGNGAAKCKDMLKNWDTALFIDDVEPSAEDIGSLAWEKFKTDQFEDVAYFEPFYLKDFIAKKPSRKKLV